MTEPVQRLRSALADRYRIERELGQGGMATVYLAHDLRHERKVAIKVLRPDLAAVIGAERFLREIKTIAHLQHPHILGLIDSGEIGGTAYYVMPFVEGESLRDRLRREQQLPVAETVRIARDMAARPRLRPPPRRGPPRHQARERPAPRRLGAGRRLRHRHRDLQRRRQPHDRDRHVARHAALHVARAGHGRARDHRPLRLYALGVVTYEMLVGEPPFTGPSAQAIIAKVLTDEPRPPTGLRKTVPPAIEAAVLTALAKLPADRFASAAEFSAALTAQAPPPRASPIATRRSRVALAAVALGALVVGAGLGALAAGRRGDARPTFGAAAKVTYEPSMEIHPALSPTAGSWRTPAAILNARECTSGS